MTSTVGVGELIDQQTRIVADWPEPGVVFRDLTPVLADGAAFAAVSDAFAGAARAFGEVDAVLGVESRGYWFAPQLALNLGVGFVPVRKQGKLPGDLLAETYDLEYGTATLEMSADALAPGARVVVVDDVLATGGTLAAADRLVQAAGGTTVGALVVIEIEALAGRAALDPLPVTALRSY